METIFLLFMLAKQVKQPYHPVPPNSCSNPIKCPSAYPNGWPVPPRQPPRPVKWSHEDIHR